jgi:hypothetical protein
MRRRSFLFGAMGAAWRGASASWASQEGLGTVAYVRRDGLWIRELPDGTPHRIVNGAKIDSPQFSASGKWITYFQHDFLHVASIDGSGAQILGKPDRGSAAPGGQWSHARDDLLVQGPAGLSVFTADSGWRRAVRRIAGASLPLAFNWDGREIVYGDAFLMRTGRLCRLALQRPDSKPRVLTSKYLSGIIPCFWSGNGDHIVYWEDPDFSASAMADGLELFRMPAEGGPPQSLGVSTLVHHDMISVSPTQKTLAVSTGGGRNEWEQKRIAVVDVETAAISYLTEKNMAAVCPAWPPSGTAIAYSAAPGPPAGSMVGGGEEARRLLAKRRIWVIDAKGANAPKPLSSDPGDPSYRDEEPMWSADGKHILFCRMATDNSNDNRKTLWLMRADGTDAVQVAGPVYIDPGALGVDDSWFGYYGYIDWRCAFDWFRG